MIGLHIHTIFSDGELLPAELIQRCQSLGHRAVALTDHVDHNNIDLVVPRLRQIADQLNRPGRVHALAGAELTRVPPELIAPLAAANNVCLEISARKGHCLGNGRVATLGLQFGAPLVVNTDAHSPSDSHQPRPNRTRGPGRRPLTPTNRPGLHHRSTPGRTPERWGAVGSKEGFPQPPFLTSSWTSSRP